jgi:serine protease Do
MIRKKSFVYFIVIVTLVISLTLSGCVLPEITFSRQPAPTVTMTATTTATPSPINPAYTAPPIPTASASVIDLPDLVSVIAKVRPSVVAINTKVPTMSIFGGTFTQEGAGSGWILDSDGLIVTNNHVVEGANSITVTLEDGRDFSADTVRTDAVSDLAVLKIKANNLPAAIKVGDSSAMRVGDWVIAIGNQLGQGIAASQGIVSAKGVSVSADNGETLYDLIQTTAAINPGNSGGPLVNLAGEVIGINSIKVAQVGVEGMGYAISSQVAIPIINELVNKGYITRPWLGAGLYTVNETVFYRYHLPINKGVLITQIVSGGPSDAAGLKAGDIIVSIDGKDITTVDALVKEVRSHSVGSTVEVKYWRDKNENTASVTLGQSPPPSSR